jgi:hypothetical protein
MERGREQAMACDNPGRGKTCLKDNLNPTERKLMLRLIEERYKEVGVHFHYF